MRRQMGHRASSLDCMYDNSVEALLTERSCPRDKFFCVWSAKLRINVCAVNNTDGPHALRRQFRGLPKYVGVLSAHVKERACCSAATQR